MMKHARRMWALFLEVAILFIFAAAPVARAQTGSAAANSSSQITAVAKLVLFEVASVRLHKPATLNYGPGFTDDGLTEHGLPVSEMVRGYYGVQRVEGLPAWARDEYDIQAKVSDQDVAVWKMLNSEQKGAAGQALLEDRFRMKSHRETRQVPGYALVVVKGGPKFKLATPGDVYANGAKRLDGSPLLGSMMEIRRDVIVGQAISMANLAEFLSMPAQRPVLDKTGLTGVYDVALKVDRQPPPASSAEGVGAAPEPTDVSIFTMVQEQLGLKLESGATVPVEFLVIDHIERPTEN